MRATACTEALGLRIGEVELISEAPIAADPPQPRMMMAAMDAAKVGGAELAVSGGLVELTADVHVRFALLSWSTEDSVQPRLLMGNVKVVRGQRVLVSGMGGELGWLVAAQLEAEPWVGTLRGHGGGSAAPAAAQSRVPPPAAVAARAPILRPKFSIRSGRSPRDSDSTRHSRHGYR